ncbi:siderophore synthetase large component acetyltransferase [Streptomyces sp. KO7888]|uniref:IucA/IucC family protein n=1 Tax=Streptomyces sp. KO7888 TaxID=2602737 RepID=UPI0019F3AE62|nr:siderophore synthetase large component acetyltransferase [Streptomyces sp. KO7888]
MHPDPAPEPAPAAVSAPGDPTDPARPVTAEPAPAPAAGQGPAPGAGTVPDAPLLSPPAPPPLLVLSVAPSAADPLDRLGPYAAAQAAATENLVRCWARETDAPAPDDGLLRVPLPASGTALAVPVLYWSPTGRHRFGPPRLAGAPASAPPVDAVTLAALLVRETAGTPGPDGPDLVARVADSVRRTAVFLRDRAERPADGPAGRHAASGNPGTPDLFLAAEQALLLGHPLHPTPKSREGLTEAETHRYSPELRGSFPLHWLAVAPSVLATDSAWTERGRPLPATELTARLAADGPAPPDGHALLPLHPWQFRALLHRPDLTALLDSGLVRDLGARGPAWHPTSSVRTVHRTGAPAMLKLSLALHITNSRRENLRKELHRGVEVHRLLRRGLFRRWQAAHPDFDIVRDPAWIAVDRPDGTPARGLDVVVRHNPFRPSDDVSCVAALVAPRPRTRAAEGATGQDGSGAGARSRLAELVTRLAGRTGRPRAAVAVEWFLRYLHHVVRPVLWLDARAGIALEAHQQNTLVLLDADGWPSGGRYRDNQGYYFRESRRTELEARLPGIGAHSDTFVADDVTDERFAYYLAVNNVFGLVGAFGSQGLADEGPLLAAFRRFLGRLVSGPAPLGGPLPAYLLDSPSLRCKANLLTRLHGLDELVGPVDTQSVYVTIANPLRA